MSGVQQAVHRLRNPIDDIQLAHVEAQLDEGVRLRGDTAQHFIALSILSSVIAALGLLLDSAAAVIGAMLLGHFMTPLLAVAASLLRGNAPRLLRAAFMAAVGVVISVGAAFIVGWVVSPRVDTDSLRPQLLALTRPGLLDLVIALAAGVAAGHAPLTLYSRQVVSSNRLRDAVENTVAQWDPSVRLVSIVVEGGGDDSTIEVTITGPLEPQPASTLAQLIADRENLDVELVLRFTLVEERTATAADP